MLTQRTGAPSEQAVGTAKKRKMLLGSTHSAFLPTQHASALGVRLAAGLNTYHAVHARRWNWD